MTFAQLSQRKSSIKRVIVEVDITAEEDFWISYTAGVWRHNLDGIYPDVHDDLLIDAPHDLEYINVVGSMFADLEPMTRVPSIAACQATDGTFYFDESTRTVYAHFLDHEEPFISTILVGEIFGFSDKTSVFNDQIYKGRIISIPDLSAKKDQLFFGRITYSGGEAELENRDGFFDRWNIERDIFGNAMRIKIGFDTKNTVMDYADYVLAYKGFVGRVTVSEERAQIEIRDDREKLEKKIPENQLTLDDYPDMSPDNAGRFKPLRYGLCEGVEAICLNDEEDPSPANYRFLAADTSLHNLKSLEAVYVNGEAISTPSLNVSTGEFVIPSASYEPGDEVTIDLKGYVFDGTTNLIEKATDQIKDLLLQFVAGISFTDDFFDTTEWAAAEAVSYKTAYDILDEISMVEVIEELSSWVLGSLITKADGRFSFRIYDSERAPAQKIRRAEIMNRIEIPWKPEEVVAKTLVKYRKLWYAQEYKRRYLNETYAANAFKRYKTEVLKVLETCLTDETEVDDYSEGFLSIFKDVKPVFKLDTKMQSVEREVADFVIAELNRRESQMIGYALCEVLGVTKRLLQGSQVSLECRLVEAAACYDEVYGGGAYLNTNLLITGGAADTEFFGCSYGGGGAQI